MKVAKLSKELELLAMKERDTVGGVQCVLVREN